MSVSLTSADASVSVKQFFNAKECAVRYSLSLGQRHSMLES